MNFNYVDILLLRYGLQYVSATLVTHLQGDFFENKNTVIIKVSLNHSTVLKIHIISG
jgi:hypothetical protein